MPIDKTQLLEIIENQVIYMAISGQWNLHYSWGCSGSYIQVGITFNSNGTFSIPSQNLAGRWTQNDGMILWQFNNNASYGGNLAGNAMVGIMSTFAGLNGCWYAIKAGSTVMPAEEEKVEFDAAGEEVK
ncbi:hypothetical protein SAMN02910340_01764 [Methanosarcina thermophila]|jgi:hypothetical protein|uniref:Uncharacterized protein n=2 Tax=Methanosarcina thermophila TaxID=2210 RepID=A0A1I6ZY38_METTE|nr:conserved hypothetical protein [Methanosarcina thermophila]GLI13738.1 hypothetical protein MTHERMMSTA1_08640 [Methanosarcina thermophila MST-A1]SFT67618.1 hypothetical protein SAMN02910340_01764 [Methanosarcina thermophila]